MKKFFSEFKTFIMRGNVIDLAVGVIIGGAFSAIITALTTNILTPLINWIIYIIFGGNGDINGVYTVLMGVYSADGALDTANSIFINWGAFISSIINFLLIALVLFIIVKTANKFNSETANLFKKINKKLLSKEDVKILKSRGIKLTDKEKVNAYILEKETAIKLKAEQEKKEQEEKAKLEREQNPTELDILKEIKALLEKKSK